MKKDINIKPQLNLNINKDDSEINDFLFCWNEFGTRPNKILIHNTYTTSLFNNMLSEYIIEKNYFTEVLPADESFIINDKMFVKISENIYCSYVVFDRNQEDSMVSDLYFFYKSIDDFEQIQEIIEKSNSCILNFCENDSNKLNTLSISSQNVLEIEPVDTANTDLDNFGLYYNKKTFKEINKLVKEIKNSNKGLSILYGERGLGKTSIINYIASKLDRIVIFISNNMIENTINNSEFRKFLKKYYKPILIIDDCEMLYSDMFSKSNAFSNNLLQMVDGFLSDNLEVNVITIFNVESEDEIDESLLECNNLLKSIEFQLLSEEESTELSDFIGQNKTYKNKMRVLDIIKNKKPKDTTHIGF